MMTVLSVTILPKYIACPSMFLWYRLYSSPPGSKANEKHFLMATLGWLIKGTDYSNEIGNMAVPSHL